MISLTGIKAELCKRDLHYFVKEFFNEIQGNTQSFIDTKLIGVVCAFLQGVKPGDKVVINQPPSTSKSTVCSILYPVWKWINDPTLKMCTVSYSPSISEGFAYKSAMLMQTEKFQKYFPHLNLIKPNKISKSDYNTTLGGRRFSTSIGSKFTSQHFDIITLDDSAKAADSKNRHEEILQWAKNTLPSRFISQKDGILINVQQRLHEGDLSAYFLEMKYKSLIMPMEFDPDRKDPLDWRTEKGEILVPETITQEILDKYKIDLGDYYHAQLNQEPTDPTTAIFKPEYFRTAEMPATFDKLIISVDMAVYDKPSADYSSAILIGQSKGNYYVVTELIHAKLEFTDMLNEILNIYNSLKSKYPKNLIEIVIEAKASGAAIVNVLKQKLQNVHEYNVGARSKIERAQAITHLFRGNLVFISTEMSQDWVKELLGFPRAKNDDRVDSLSQGLAYLSQGSTLDVWDLLRSKHNK